MRHPDRERLTLVALGEEPESGELAAHLDRCARCRAEVTAMRDTVVLGREAGIAPLEAPPAHVWSSISAELGLDTAGDAARPADRPERASGRGRAVAAVALAAVVVAGLVGILVGIDGVGPRELARAPLSAYGASPTAATGEVRVLDNGDQRRLDVTTDMPPAPGRGYYEVWLLDTRTGDMVAVGALGESGRGSFTMPAGLDMTSYPVVDVSAERYDGDPAHATSILRGTLAP